jgi:flavin reductase (DIM6/NTAB) family NADH-FMN oxidoreductase RutF/DNA-binding transcriptional LysR family regulator
MTLQQLREQFIDGMSHAACTVSVVTTDGAAGRAGVTVSAMASVAADGPSPTLLVCVHHLSPAAKCILENGVFCVNVLRENQSFISDSFAGRAPVEGGDKFSCTDWVVGKTGAPQVADCLVAFDCRLITSHRVETHHVFFGGVENVTASNVGSALIYADRAYGRPARLSHGKPVAGDPLPDKLRLGSFHTFGPYVVPQVMSRLYASGHPVTVSLTEGDQDSLMNQLRQNELDIAIVYDIGLPQDLEVERLGEIESYALLPEAHPLAAMPTVSLSELSEEPMILLETPPSGDYFLSLFAQHGLKPNIFMRTGSFEMVRGMVGNGLGYGLLGTKPASNMSYDGKALVTKPLTEKTPSSHIALLYRKTPTLGKAAQLFADECRRYFQTFEMGG